MDRLCRASNVRFPLSTAFFSLPPPPPFHDPDTLIALSEPVVPIATVEQPSIPTSNVHDLLPFFSLLLVFDFLIFLCFYILKIIALFIGSELVGGFPKSLRRARDDGCSAFHRGSRLESSNPFPLS